MSLFFLKNLVMMSVSKNYLPIWEAMLGGHVEIVEIFIELGANPDIECSDEEYLGCTFLQYAAQIEYTLDNYKVAEVLIKHGAEINTTRHIHEIATPLQITVLNGNLKFLELFLKNNPRLDWDESHASPAELVFAIENDSIVEEMLRLLFVHGLDPKFQDRNHDNLMHLLLNSKELDEDPVPLAEVLLNYGVPLNDIRVEDKATLLHRAILRKDVKLTALFLKKGADANARDVKFKYPLDPLSTAVTTGSLELVELLLSNGADVNVQDDEFGWTALHVACTSDNYDKKIVELLIRRGGDVNIKDKLGHTTLYLLKLIELKRRMETNI